jgi:hypothetical protein
MEKPDASRYPINVQKDDVPAAAANAAMSGMVRVRGARAQSQECRSRPAAQCAGRLHRHFRLGQIVAGIWHAVRRSAAPIPRIGLAVCAPALQPDAGARGRRDRRLAARRGAAAATRLANHALLARSLRCRRTAAAMREKPVHFEITACAHNTQSAAMKKACRALHGERRMRRLPRQAAARGIAVGPVRGT